MAVAVVLRSVRLGSSLWFDEIVSLVEFVRLPLSSLVTSLSSLNNHILYSVEAHVAIAIFGESAWALRLPAMLFGVASVAMLWFFARSVVSPAEANMAALLLAVSYHGIWFSQNARGYTGLMFWALAGTYLFMEGIHRPTWRVWIAYGLVVAAAAYTHLSAGFFFVIHGLVYLALLAWRGRFGKRYPGLLEFKPFAGFLIGGLVAFLLHAPLLPQLLAAMQSVAVTSASETTVAEWKNPLWTILEVVRNLRSLGFVALVGLPVVLGFSTIGAVSLSRRQPVVAAIALIHIPLTLVILILMSFRIWPRYFFIDLAFIFLCLVRGVFVFAEFVAPYFSRLNAFFQTERLGVLACLSAAICSLFLLPPNYRFPKQDFLGAKEFVETARTPQDNVVSIGLASYAYSQYYGGPDWKVAESWPEIQEIRHSTGRPWLIYTSTAHMNENYPDVVTGVASDFELVKLFPGTLGDGAVFVYRSRGSLGASLRP
jgi:uncharacterized membrane protein